MLPFVKERVGIGFRECQSQVLQSTTKHLEQAMKNWFQGSSSKTKIQNKEK